MTAKRKKTGVAKKSLTQETLIPIYDLMVKARVLEERLVKMSKSGLGFFWLGGPGEEAFNVPLGMMIDKGEGIDHDFLHFHYRQSATLLAMGMPMVDPIRQMHSTATDPFSGGRNFISHFSIKKWNVVKIASTIETQYASAIGTGVAQARHGGKGITIVTGGDAGTAEGEFASCLAWASRAKQELPILIIVTNNQYGISTPFLEVHSDLPIAKRGEGFGIRNAVVDGNDVTASHRALTEAFQYVREKRKPFLLEARLSRLYGHSSASGANRTFAEVDCIVALEKELKKRKILGEEDFKKIREKYERESMQALKQVLNEPKPEANTIMDHIFAERKDALQPWPRWLKR